MKTSSKKMVTWASNHPSPTDFTLSQARESRASESKVFSEP